MHALNVLLVDDQKLFTESLKKVLELEKELIRKVTVAYNGQEAVQAVDEVRPDVVLMDRSMPGMDGITCTKKILDQDPNARVVLISGYDEEGIEGIDSRIRALIAGYLTKPIDIHELSHVLAEIFSG